MHKRTCSFTDPQHDYITKSAKELGISYADLVRRIVDEHRAASIRSPRTKSNADQVSA